MRTVGLAPGDGIVGAEEGKGLFPWAWVARKVNGCRTFWLATILAGYGRPHVMPVWGVWLDDAFFFSTGRKSRVHDCERRQRRGCDRERLSDAS